MIDIRQLRQFVAVAENLHFGRAAQQLHMTQPPLSLAIQRLEGEIGTQLFDRSTRHVLLTAAGSAALLHARALLAASRDFPEQVRRAAAGTVGVLRIGLVSTVSYGPFPEWIDHFKVRQPDIGLELIEATLDRQLQLFAAGAIDVGWVLIRRGTSVPGFEVLRLWNDPMVLAIPGNDPLGRIDRPTPGQIALRPIIVFPRPVSPTLYDGLETWYEGRNTPMQVAQNATQMHTILGLVAASIGLAWVPEAMRQIGRPGIVYKSIPSMKLRAETCLIYRDGGNPVVARFVAFLEQTRSGSA